jgi:hypothetical protein
VLQRFCRRGVASLLDAAREYGFEPEASYPQKCYLCLQLRAFLRERDVTYRAVFGPDEVYGDA